MGISFDILNEDPSGVWTHSPAAFNSIHHPVRENVQFPNKVWYFEGAEDVPGERQKGILRVKEGQMAVVYKTDDPHWWLGKARRCFDRA